MTMKAKALLTSTLRAGRSWQLQATDSENAVRRDLEADWSKSERWEKPLSASRRFHIVITSTGRSNIGDQAMFESVVANMAGRIVAITGPRATLTVPPSDRSRVEIVPIPALVYGAGPNHRRAVTKLISMMEFASSFSVIGADLMDGGYQRRTAAICWTLARIAASRAIPTAIFGFSWKEGADSLVAGEAARAVEAGAHALVRDPDSAHRFERDTGVRATRVTDLVFAAELVPAGSKYLDQIRDWRTTGRGTVLLNASALIDRKVDLLDDYLDIIRRARGANREVMLIPHVGGRDGGDFAVASKLRARARQDGLGEIPQVQEVLTPNQVFALAQAADLVVTGRMHLSILAMRAVTPALVISTHGKVGGLLRLFDLPHFVIPLARGLSSEVGPQLTRELESDGDAKVAIARRLPEVMELAQLNFAHTR